MIYYIRRYSLSDDVEWDESIRVNMRNARFTCVFFFVLGVCVANFGDKIPKRWGKL